MLSSHISLEHFVCAKSGVLDVGRAEQKKGAHMNMSTSVESIIKHRNAPPQNKAIVLVMIAFMHVNVCDLLFY